MLTAVRDPGVNEDRFVSNDPIATMSTFQQSEQQKPKNNGPPTSNRSAETFPICSHRSEQREAGETPVTVKPATTVGVW